MDCLAKLPKDVWNLTKQVSFPEKIGAGNAKWQLHALYMAKRAFSLYDAALILYDMDKSHDATPICRSIYEFGLTTAYIHKIPDDRVERLEAYGVVNQKRLFDAIHRGSQKFPWMKVDPERKSAVDADCRRVEAKYKGAGKIFPDMKHRAIAVDAEHMHDIAYNLHSAASHPDPTEMMRYVQRQNGRLNFIFPSPDPHDLYLNNATGSVIFMMEVMNELYKFGYENAIQDLTRRLKDNEPLLVHHPENQAAT